jgi:hypothetical protein
MIQLIVGDKGKGKTKELLDKVNAEIKDVQGSVVYLDKSTKHMYELNNRIRLIDVSEFEFQTTEEFIGFICGIMSQDHDLEKMYFDSFLRIACIDQNYIEPVIRKLENLSDKFNVDFVLSVSMNKEVLPDNAKSKVILAL